MSNLNQPLTPEHIKLQAILENAVDAIITIDERGIIESVNPATTRLFQFSAEELIGRNVNLLMPSPYREAHNEYIENYLRSGIRKIIGIGREVIGQRKDGTTFPIHVAVSEVAVEDRRIFTGIVRDISDVKEAERQLAELNNELELRFRQRTAELREAQAELLAKEKLATLGQVSGGIAHEIRNPLNAVKSSAYYLMNATDASHEKRKEHLERIDRQVTLIDNVITALADVAKLPDPIVSAIPLEPILAKVIREVTMPAGVSVELHISEHVGTIMADEYQIPIVFRNLLRNARDAMPEGGTISIIAEPRGDEVAIMVRDTGVGIAKDTLGQIVEPLYSTKARGMGLGLAICKAIIEKNGGQLQIESELGKGSSFTVVLGSGAR